MGATEPQQPATEPPLHLGARGTVLPDPLYGSLRVPQWAADLLETPPFLRLAQVSLSDVPGTWLFKRPFPSRLEHARGVFHLARLARPRDRTLQVAALAHDLGHGPFSHLSEPLMRERLGCDHEERSARLLHEVRAHLSPPALRRLAWLDWDEAAQLILGTFADGRGALLNGHLDYDNADNVARFLAASGIGVPAYDPRVLARALRVSPTGAAPAADAAERASDPDGELVGNAPIEVPGDVYLLASAEREALGWRAARRAVYAYLHEQHRNLAAHAMLRKAIDLAALSGALPTHFFDMTDDSATALLAGLRHGGGVLLRAVRSDALHRCIWEAEVPGAGVALAARVARWRDRLALEERLASEAGLAAHDVVVEAITSSARRALPPLAPASHPEQRTTLPEPPPAPCILHVFLAPHASADYARRLAGAADRAFAPLGVVRHEAATSVLTAPAAE